MLKHLKGRFFGLAEIFADSGKKGIGALHLLQKEQFPGIGSNQPGADPQILDIAFLGEIFRILWGGNLTILEERM